MNRDEILKRYNLIEDNINRIKEKYNINYDVSLVAVSKYSSIETIKEFLSLNIDLPLGESRAQSLRDRVGEIGKIKDNVKWLRETFNANPEKYGDNVISAQFHGDEVGNVHIHAFIIPIDDKGKLNASYYINGRKQLSMLQSSYGKVMQENHNLKRGLKGSQASHNDIKHFYASLNQKVEMEPPQYKDNESLEDYYKRVKESYRVLNEQILALELKYQRKYDEFKTLNINEAIEYERLKEERKTYDKILDKFGSLDFAWNRLETISDLNEGLKNYPDREYAKKAQKMIKTLISYQESEARDIQIDDKEDHQI